MTNHTPPDGWVMVPREPTEAMIEAGCRALHELQGTGDADEVAHSPYQSSWDVPDSIRWRQWEETIVGDEGEGGIYRALLAAAPTSAQPISEQSSNCDDVTTTPPLGEGKAVPYGYWIEDGVENGFQRGGLTWGEIATLDANGIKVIPLYAPTPPSLGEADLTAQRTALSPAAAGKSLDMVAWLLEWPADDNLPSRWWHPVTGWMLDANKALRFCRKEDVEAYRQSRILHGKATEHMFVRADAAAPTPPLGEGKAVAAKLGLFDHHPDPAIDFCIEVEEIEAQAWNLKHGLHAPTEWQLNNRIRKAMYFRVGGDQGAVAAKDKLREIEKSLAAPNSPVAEKAVAWRGRRGDYPIGTKAHHFNGGHWTRTERGWQWNGGDTFPQPGPDAFEVEIPALYAHPTPPATGEVGELIAKLRVPEQETSTLGAMPDWKPRHVFPNKLKLEAADTLSRLLSERDEAREALLTIAAGTSQIFDRSPQTMSFHEAQSIARSALPDSGGEK